MKKRLLSEVEFEPNSGCWLWAACRNDAGYGVLKTGSRRSVTRAHRLSYELFVGPFDPFQFVCHRCDNPPCVNPDHLFIGDAAANAGDMARKLRQPNRKLSPSDVWSMRERMKAGEHLGQLAEEFGISGKTAMNIRDGKSWNHLEVTSDGH